MSDFDKGFARGVAWAAGVADKAVERIKALPPTRKNQAAAGAIEGVAEELRADLASAAIGSATPVAESAEAAIERT